MATNFIPYEKYHDYSLDLLKITTVSAIAQVWGVSVKSVHGWIDKGYVVARQIGGDGGAWLVHVDSVIAYRGVPQDNIHFIDMV